MSTERTTSELEAQLYANQAMAAGGKCAEALARLKQARAHLAYIQLAVMAPACGFNLAKPDAEMAGMSREVGIYKRHAQSRGVWRDVVIVEALLTEP